ncbi:YeeE/YedE family protein [Faunimonas sp. B44]|uniref:YeeE/YedE family protein n=1 Tax=Faunimonas sp. B44 TaxID=3461493 RepID=UPI0040450104
MNLEPLMEFFGEDATLALGGLAVGILFGVFAQRSRFCLRAAVIEFRRMNFGRKLAVWLLAFASALAGTQALVLAGLLETGDVRQLATTGSLSGAAIGGLMFGAGMILARGCASRLLVLSANGNLRALLSGLIFAVTAQAAWTGALAPAREALTGLWLVEGGPSRDLLAITGLGHAGGLAFAFVWLAAGLYFAARSRLELRGLLGGIGVGLAIAAGWFFTYQAGTQAFGLVETKSVTFSGPSAETLMYVLDRERSPFDFDIALVVGVFLGSFVAAWLGRELTLEGFRDARSMRRYIAGAVLMGFGAMLAGGCAVGAGVTGGSVFAITAWVTLFGIWIAAAATDWALERFGTGDAFPEPSRTPGFPAPPVPLVPAE